MHRFLRHWEKQGCGWRFKARVINYADDFVILSRCKAKEPLEWTRQVMLRLKLTINETKTCVRLAATESFDFLGYTFGPLRSRMNGQYYLGATRAVRTTIVFLPHHGTIAASQDIKCNNPLRSSPARAAE